VTYQKARPEALMRFHPGWCATIMVAKLYPNPADRRRPTQISAIKRNKRRALRWFRLHQKRGQLKPNSRCCSIGAHELARYAHRVVAFWYCRTEIRATPKT
jgi:hypothetical protein